ncbi:hypothetical protein H0H10_36080 [Streptomyces sp. TRM S81-3]|uniref:Uncharacterized protein n=1 Tax=Streptomyces griseicoloratus TaxID=2752516 RepID=A0A926QTW5_9ACTN|nr:hypothetical protein [Streptomyces griseicoloratus]MBD0424524.1 hypothetical protein [Streptomyces griseicoloratus]
MKPADPDELGAGRTRPGGDGGTGPDTAAAALAHRALGALAALAARWDEFSGLLPPRARRELRGLLDAFRTAEPRGVEQARIAARATEAVLAALPPDAAERLRRDTGVTAGEPAGDGTRLVPSPSAALSGGYSALDLCLLVVDRNPMVGPRLGPVRRRLLAAPALSATEVADSGNGTRAADARGAGAGTEDTQGEDTRDEDTQGEDTRDEGTRAADSPAEGSRTKDTRALDSPAEGSRTKDTRALDSPAEGSRTKGTRAVDSPAEGARSPGARGVGAGTEGPGSEGSGTTGVEGPGAEGARDVDAGGRSPRGLIALTDDGGQTVFPAFQFAAGTTPWPVVLEVNAVLEAEADPWGAADWWLSPHTWWGAPPAGLLGRGRDAELRAAARAVAAPEGW